MKKFFLLAGCAAVLIFVASAVVFAESLISQAEIYEGLKICDEYPVKLVLDDKEIVFDDGDIPPVIIKSRTLIPARALFESMGGEVLWDEEKEAVEIHLKDDFVSLAIGSAVALVNGEEKTLEVPAVIIAREGELYGRTMIPARFTAEALGCEVDWDEQLREVIIASPASPDQEEEEEDEDWEDEDEERGEKDSPEIASGAAISFWDPFEYEPLDVMNEAAAQKLIAIDLGHGGTDTGAIGHEDKKDELYEKKVNLKVGLYLKEYLTEAGASIYMLREKDKHIALYDRAEIANSIGADLFVSIHNNSSEFDWPTGTEVHYYSKVDEDGRDEMELYGIYSKNVAKRVQKEMLAALGTFDRGIKNSPKLAVLNKTVMPAIIIEGAFLSNEEDFEMIKTDEYAKRYAYAAAKGIIAAMNAAYKEL
ncbi:MAG: N-acetylmuramoyl-L-alanine amidase [Clostridiales bacterium]|nr:N-acetylmuramoyl-L-alanine amidase [Clostridiales bacterium]